MSCESRAFLTLSLLRALSYKPKGNERERLILIAVMRSAITCSGCFGESRCNGAFVIHTIESRFPRERDEKK